MNLLNFLEVTLDGLKQDRKPGVKGRKAMLGKFIKVVRDYDLLFSLVDLPLRRMSLEDCTRCWVEVEASIIAHGTRLGRGTVAYVKDLIRSGRAAEIRHDGDKRVEDARTQTLDIKGVVTIGIAGPRVFIKDAPEGLMFRFRHYLNGLPADILQKDSGAIHIRDSVPSTTLPGRRDADMG